MEPFFVSPVESLLLGFAWGEYLQNKNRHPELRFLGEVSDRLAPFLPDLRQHRRIRMSEDDLPADIEWRQLPGSHEEGYSESTPDRVYLRLVAEDRRFVVCEITDSSRKSLMDLVGSFLGELVASAPADRVALNLGPRDAAKEITHELANNLRENWEEAVLRYSATDENDDLEGISRALDDLVAFNECSEYFATGKCLGTLMVYSYSDAPEDQFADDLAFERFSAALDDLLETKLLTGDTLSVHALRHLREIARRFRDGFPSGLAPDFLPALGSVFLRSIQHDKLVAALWIALGELFAILNLRSR
jgi:hypothetical protein